MHGRLHTHGALAALVIALSAPSIAYASSRTATLAGSAAKDIAYTPGDFLDPDITGARKALKHATWFGIGVEIFTGLVRIVAVRSIVTATLLFGPAWRCGSAYERSYEHRSRQVERVKATGAVMKKTALTLGDARADRRADWGRVVSLLGPAARSRRKSRQHHRLHVVADHHCL